MRVIEPHQFQKRRRYHAKSTLWVAACLIVLIAGGAVFVFVRNDDQSKVARSQQAPGPQVQSAQVVQPPKTTPKTFTGNQFRDLYRSIVPTYPNTEAFNPLPSISGSTEADIHIRSLAEARGFQPTRIPVTALVQLNEVLVSGEKDDLLQPAAFKAWEAIKTAAKNENIPLALMSAYRSPEFQRSLFLGRLSDKGVSAWKIENNQADTAIQATLGLTAVPGYSRHHTGYTVDFWCEDGSGTFAASSCFTWLHENNYLRAKQAGWIPSYPEGADEQGPEPEPWEYVWVGRDVLFE